MISAMMAGVIVGRLENEVREIILNRYKSLAAFAREIGIPEHTLYTALSNGLAGATLVTVMPIVKELGLDPAELVEGRLAEASEPRKSALVPLYGSIAAGAPAAPDRAEDVFPIPSSLYEAHPRAFMLKVRGTSMDNVLPDGSFALIDPCQTIDYPGDMYAVAVGDEDATIKRIRLLNNGLILEPDSHDPTYHPLVFDYSNPDAPNVSVIGRVIWFCASPAKDSNAIVSE